MWNPIDVWVWESLIYLVKIKESFLVLLIVIYIYILKISYAAGLQFVVKMERMDINKTLVWESWMILLA